MIIITAKELLAKLSTHLSLPIKEYVDTSVAAEIRSNQDILSKVEPFELPEITKLICGCNDLKNQFAPKYNFIAPLYEAQSIDDIIRIVFSGDTTSTFFETVIPFCSEDILRNIESGFNRIEKEIRVTQKWIADKASDYSRLEEKLQEKEKEAQELLEIIEREEDETVKKEYKCKLAPVKGTITRTKKDFHQLQEEYDSKQAKMTRLTNMIKTASPLRTNVAEALRTYASDVAARRQNAYEACDEKNEIMFYLQSWQASRQHTNKFVNSLKSYSFCCGLMSVLEMANPEKTFSFLDSLYAIGAIDIFDEPFSSYVVGHNEPLGRIISSRIPPQATDDTISGWLDMAFEMSIESSTVQMDSLWDSVQDIGTWKYVIERLETKCPETFLDGSAKLLLSSSGLSRKLLLSLIEEYCQNGNIDSSGAFISAMIRNAQNKDECALIIEHMVQNIENKVYSINKQNEKLKLKCERIPSEVFAALAPSVEELEQLAADIDVGGINITPHTIAVKAKNSLANLREGMCALGVSAVEDTEKWASQQKIPFDASRHTIQITPPPTEIYLRTLGFEYTDDDGNKKIHAAKAGRISDLTAYMNVSPKKRDNSSKQTKTSKKSGEKKQVKKKSGDSR